MSDFNNYLAENMKNPEFAYEYGLTERELEIIKLLQERLSPITYEKHECVAIEDAIALIKGESNG